MSPVNLSHIDACTQDAKLAWGSTVAGPADPTDWGDMIAAVRAAQRYLPLVYRHQFAEPFLGTLGALGAEDLRALQERPCCADVLRPLYDIAQAILQASGPGLDGARLRLPRGDQRPLRRFSERRGPARRQATGPRRHRPPRQVGQRARFQSQGQRALYVHGQGHRRLRGQDGCGQPPGRSRAPGAGLLGHAGPRDLRARHPACR